MSRNLGDVAARLRAAASLTITQLAANTDGRALAATLAEDVKAAEHDLTTLIGPTSGPIPIPSTPAVPVTPAKPAGVEAPNEYVRKYRAILAGEPTIENRQLAFVVAVESAATLVDSDAELAETVRAIVAADQAEDAKAAAALQAVIEQTEAGRAGASSVDALRPEMTDTQDDAGSATVNAALYLAAVGAAIATCLPAVTPDAQGIVAIAGLTAIAVYLRRVLGYCRACGHRGAWRDPLTLFGRPRVHTRHLPNIRESRRASRQAVDDARRDGAR